MDRNKFYNKYFLLFSLALAITAGFGFVLISLTVGNWTTALSMPVAAAFIPVSLGGGALMTEYTYRSINKKIHKKSGTGDKK